MKSITPGAEPFCKMKQGENNNRGIVRSTQKEPIAKIDGTLAQV